MKLLSVDGRSNILNELLVTKFELMPLLLDIIEKLPRITHNELKKKSKYSGGIIYAAVKGMKVMKFVENGNGLQITELGKSFLKEYRFENKIPVEITKMGCLNVTLFRDTYHKYPEQKDSQQIFSIFLDEMSKRYNGIDPKMIGSAVRRYMQGIHNTKLGIATKINPNPQPKTDTNKIGKNKLNGELFETLRNLKVQLRLSNEDMNKMVKSLPQEKKDEIISQLLIKII